MRCVVPRRPFLTVCTEQLIVSCALASHSHYQVLPSSLTAQSLKTAGLESSRSYERLHAPALVADTATSLATLGVFFVNNDIKTKKQETKLEKEISQDGFWSR